LIQSSLADLFKGRTTFVIAHRLSTVTHADIIVAMDGGKIVEVGSHSQLIEQRGFYFEMVQRQFEQMASDSVNSSVNRAPNKHVPV
jgi:ABC-type multidrug transport system fused ATPase/permease subunit